MNANLRIDATHGVRTHPNIDVVALDARGGPLGLLWMHQTGAAAPLRSGLRRWLDQED